MASFPTIHLALLVVFVASCVGVGAIDTRRISRICNGELIKTWEPLGEVPRLFVDEIVAHTPDAELHDLYTCKDFRVSGPIYGHGTCFENLSHDDCHQCMQSAEKQLFDECSELSKGAQIRLYDCRIRYELYPFNNDD